MLRRYIEHREKVHHGRDNNRLPLPFDWGFKDLGLQQEDPSVTIGEYVSSILSDSDSFYACAATSNYDLNGEILKFPSAVETPYVENNTVWGRFYGGDDGDLAMVVLPQWNCKWDSQVALCRTLQRAGVSSLRLSLPYHHHRKPAHLERSEYLVSANIGRTLASMRQAVLDVRRAGDWLLERGFRRIGIIGTSIGSCIGFLTLAHDQRFSTAVFIHVSSYFADVVWHGLSTQHVRQSLEGTVDLQQLRFLWSPISPYPFIKRLHGTGRSMLAISGRYDLTFLPQLTQQTYEEFDRQSVPYDRVWLPCGHYTMGQLPFSVVAGYRIVRFLSKN
jgi:hypothetical protein